MARRRLALSGFLLLSGCLYNARQPADQALCDLAARPYDLLPTSAENKAGTFASPARPASSAPAGPVPVVQEVDVQTTAYMQATSGENRATRLGANVTRPARHHAAPGESTGFVSLPVL